MTTAYTRAVIEDPEMTLEAFAMRCARSCGYLGFMQDYPMNAPIPLTVVPDSGPLQAANEARTRLDKLQSTSSEEADRLAVSDHEYHARMRVEVIASRTARNDRLNEMLAKVESWTPPTTDHEALKRFMIEQLRSSIEAAIDWPACQSTSGQAWLDDAKERAEEDLKRHHERWLEAQDRARKATRWLEDLRASLR